MAKAIIQLSLPMMLAMVAQMIYNITDTFFIGQTGDPNMVAGISLAMPLFMISQGVGNIFGVGASNYISRLLGARKDHEAKQTSSVAFWTTLGMGILFTALLFFFRKPILRLSGASEATFVYADSYFSIINAFIAFALLNIVLSGLMRSEGATVKATQGMLIGIVLNVILDPIFILFLGWGVAGAAWATIIGTIASVTFYCLNFFSHRSVLSIRPENFKPTAVIYGEILKIGIPVALSNIAMTVCSIFRNRVASSYGDFVIAGSGINMRIASISFMLIMALASGYQPFAGFNYGANNFKRLKEGFRITIIYSTILSLFFTIIFAFGGRFIFTLFIRDNDTVNAGVKLLYALLWALPFVGFQMTMMVTFRALGKSLLALVVTLGRDFLFYLPLLFLFNHLWQFNGYMYSQPVADGLTSIVALVFTIRLFKQMDVFDKGEKHER